MLAIFANDLERTGRSLLQGLFVFLFLFITPAAGTLLLSLPESDVSFSVHTNVTLTWNRTFSDPGHFTLQTRPPSSILSNTTVQANGALSGTVGVVFGNVGLYVLQAFDDDSNLLEETSQFTVQLATVFNSSTIFPLMPIKTVTGPTSLTVVSSTETQTVDPTESPTPTAQSGAAKVNTTAIVVGSILGVVVLLLIITLLLFWRKRTKDKELRRFTFHRDLMIRPGESDTSSVTPIPDHYRPSGGIANDYSDVNLSEPASSTASLTAGQVPLRNRPAYGYSPTILVGAQIQPVNAPYPPRFTPLSEAPSAPPMMSSYSPSVSLPYQKPQPPVLNTRQLPVNTPEDQELLTAATAMSTNSVEMRLKMRDGIEKMRAQRTSFMPPIEESRSKPLPVISR